MKERLIDAYAYVMVTRAQLSVAQRHGRSVPEVTVKAITLARAIHERNVVLSSQTPGSEADADVVRSEMIAAAYDRAISAAEIMVSLARAGVIGAERTDDVEELRKQRALLLDSERVLEELRTITPDEVE
jgi:hypothetical protein